MSLDIGHVANLCRVDFGAQKRAVASHSELMRDEIRLQKTQQADECRKAQLTHVLMTFPG